MAKTVNAKRVEFDYENETYRMDVYKDSKVLMYKKVDGVFDFVPAKTVILLKLQELNPVQYPVAVTRKRNTRFTGRKLYSLLKG